jgi:hypothetical protein
MRHRLVVIDSARTPPGAPALRGTLSPVVLANAARSNIHSKISHTARAVAGMMEETVRANRRGAFHLMSAARYLNERSRQNPAAISMGHFCSGSQLHDGDASER